MVSTASSWFFWGDRPHAAGDDPLILQRTGHVPDDAHAGALVVDVDQPAVQVGATRVLDDLAGSPRVERTSVVEAHLPAVSVGDDVQLAGDLEGCATPVQRAELEPVHHRPDQRQLQPTGHAAEAAGLPVDEPPLDLPHAEQVGRTGAHQQRGHAGTPSSTCAPGSCTISIPTS